MHSTRHIDGPEARRFGRFAATSLLAGILLVAGGCGGSTEGNGERDCVPGRVQSCSCTGGGSGTQTCQSDGTLGACSCAGADAGVDGSASDPGEDGSSEPPSDAGTDASGPPAEHSVELPIEVIGADGYTRQVSVGVREASKVSDLWLKAYSIGYPYYEDYDVEKASIRLNGGSWVDVTNEVAECPYPESKLDCVSGPYPTIRFEIPIETLGASNLEEGENTLTFRFNYAFPEDSPDDFGDKSTGYRILGIEFRDGEDNDHVDATAFEWDDPAEWTAPEGFGDEESVAEGKKLWNERDLLVDSWGGDEITASCADCHAETGRDLKYFAFSNWSIIARSNFHGLSDKKGKKIAAYIRSLELKDPDDGHSYEAPGRPWHPPYQPGPTSVASRSPDQDRTEGTSIHEMPSNGSQYYAAGAGLEWALDRDRETAEHLLPGDVEEPFPDGVDGTQIDVDASLDMVELPVAIQFPDWNEWLPTHHPIDVFGDDFKSQHVGGRDWNVWDVYYGENEDRAARREFLDCWDEHGNDSQCFSGQFSPANRVVKMLWEDGTQWGKRTSDAWVEAGYRNMTQHDKEAFRRLQVQKFATVKQWEVQNKYDLLDEADHTWSNTDPLHYLGGDQRLPFDNAPHITGPYAGDKSGAWDLWLDNAWYELQTHVASGRGISVGIRPVDWKYQNMHINGYAGALGLEHPMRVWATAIKVMQNCESFSGFADEPRAWFQRNGHCDYGSHTIRRDWTWGATDEYRSGLAVDLHEAVFGQYVEGMMYRHSPDLGENVDKNWTRKSGEHGWERETYELITRGHLKSREWHRAEHTPSHYWQSLHDMKEKGVRPALLDRGARWLDAMNPSGAWDQFICTSNGGDMSC